MNQTDLHLTPEHLRTTPAYTRARAALRTGATPARVIQDLVTTGLPPHEVVALMQLLAETLAAERRFEALTAQSVGRYIMAQLQAGNDSTMILRDLRRLGVHSVRAQQLVTAARNAWARQEARRRQQARRQRLRERAVLGLLAAAIVIGVGQVPNRRSASHIPLAEVTVDPHILALAPPVPNAVVVSEQANARSGPGPEYPVLQEIPARTPLRVVGWVAPENRYLIQLPDDRPAWVRSDPTVVELTVPRESIARFRITP